MNIEEKNELYKVMRIKKFLAKMRHSGIKIAPFYVSYFILGEIRLSPFLQYSLSKKLKRLLNDK